MAIFDPDVFDPDVFDAGPTGPFEPSSPEGVYDVQPMTVMRNGEEVEDFILDNEQWAQLELVDAAYDAEIGQGTFVMPGSFSWLTGDRISFVSDGQIIGTCFLISPTMQQNGRDRFNFETSWSTMDPNRILVGRRVVDWDSGLGSTATDVIVGFITDFLDPTLTIDQTWVDTEATVIPRTNYKSDGIMNILADIIRLTGWTAFVTVDQYNGEGTFQFHFHALTGGETSAIKISDDPTEVAADADTFFPQGAQQARDFIDLHTVVEGTNSVNTATSIASELYDQGGITFEAALDFGGLSESDLTLVVGNLTNLGEAIKTTARCVIGPLSCTQAAALQAGMLIETNCPTLGAINGDPLRVARRTLRVATDSSGTALPGLWMAELELGFPLRSAAAAYNFGGQGGALGRLTRSTPWNATPVKIDNPFIGVGETTNAVARLMWVDHDPEFTDETDLDTGIPIPVEDVTIYWQLEEIDALGYDSAGDYALGGGSTQTDNTGRATRSVLRVAEGTTVYWRVLASDEPFPT